MADARSPAELFKHDMDLCAGLTGTGAGSGELAGADEAGRGCLAGPIVAAAVVFDYSGENEWRFAHLLDHLHDSKKLTEARREALFPAIITAASRFSVVVASNHTIDARGLHNTNLRILEESLILLSPCPPAAIVDGYSLKQSSISHRSFNGADATSACVAAASVLAKVSRDRIMRRLDADFPEYGFAQHKGYATEGHRAAISRHGLSSIHRRSFKTGPLPQISSG